MSTTTTTKLTTTSMTTIKIKAPDSIVSAEIDLPISKSIVSRLLMLWPEKTLDWLSQHDDWCDDIRVMMVVMRKMIEADGNPTSSEVVLDVHASGTAMRFLTALCSVKSGVWVLRGTTRLCERPIRCLVDALRSVGADIEYLDKEGFLPLKIRGNDTLEGGRIEIDASESSQYVSALMMVAQHFKRGLEISRVGDGVSTPYVKMTASLLKKSANDISELIEYDWSAAAFWYEMKFIADKIGRECGEISLKGLNYENSLQGDKAIVDILESLNSHRQTDGCVVMDFRDTPDLVVAVAVSCCLGNIPFVMTGVKNLRIKETDRIDALCKELNKMGYVVSGSSDEIIWEGIYTEPLSPIRIQTYSDHRMAMAFAPCALKFGEIEIVNPEVVEKSYPLFWDNLQKLGFDIEITELNAESN